MPQSAHDTLVLSIVASVLGALVMCLLVARYGLTPAAEEDRGATARRLMITRLGHAFSGVCFVATGVLALVAIGRQAPAAPPAPPTVVVRPDPAAEQRLHAIVADMQSIASRLDQVVSRLAAVDSTTRRLGDEVASVQLRAREMERALAALPRRAATPDPPKPSRAKTVPAPSSAPPTVISPAPQAPPYTPTTPASEPAAAPRSVGDRPSTAPATPAAAPTTETASQPRAPAVTRPPEPPKPSPSPPTAARAPERAAPLRSTAPVPRPAGQAARQPADGGAAAAGPDDLVDKIRDDWKMIRERFSKAGDEVEGALRDLGRKLWR